MNNKRREKLKLAISYIEKASQVIEDVSDEELDSLDNIPDNLQYSDANEKKQTQWTNLKRHRRG